MRCWYRRTGKVLLWVFMLVAIYLLFAGEFLAAAFISGPFGLVLWKLRHG